MRDIGEYAFGRQLLQQYRDYEHDAQRKGLEPLPPLDMQRWQDVPPGRYVLEPSEALQRLPRTLHIAGLLLREPQVRFRLEGTRPEPHSVAVEGVFPLELPHADSEPYQLLVLEGEAPLRAREFPLTPLRRLLDVRDPVHIWLRFMHQTEPLMQTHYVASMQEGRGEGGLFVDGAAQADGTGVSDQSRYKLAEVMLEEASTEIILERTFLPPPDPPQS